MTPDGGTAPTIEDMLGPPPPAQSTAAPGREQTVEDLLGKEPTVEDLLGSPPDAKPHEQDFSPEGLYVAPYEPAPARERADTSRPNGSWLDVAKSVGSDLLDIPKRALNAGIEETMSAEKDAASGGPLALLLQKAVQKFAPATDAKMQAGYEQAAQSAYNIYNSTDLVIKQRAEDLNLTPGSAKDMAKKVGDGIVGLIPIVASSAAGPEAPLMLMFSQGQGEHYQQARDKGMGRGGAAAEGTVLSGLETLTAAVPIRVVTSGAGGLLEHVVNSAAAFGAQSGVITALEQAYEARKMSDQDQNVYGPGGMTFAEAWDKLGGWDNVKSETATGALTGAAVGAGHRIAAGGPIKQAAKEFIANVDNTEFDTTGAAVRAMSASAGVAPQAPPPPNVASPGAPSQRVAPDASIPPATPEPAPAPDFQGILRDKIAAIAPGKPAPDFTDLGLDESTLPPNPAAELATELSGQAPENEEEAKPKPPGLYYPPSGQPFESANAARVWRDYHKVDGTYQLKGQGYYPVEVDGGWALQQREAAPLGAQVGKAIERAQNPDTSDLVSFLAAHGGIADNEGHDLENAVGNKMVPGVGHLLSPEGMTLEDAEDLTRGIYHGSAEVDPNAPSKSHRDFIGLLRQARDNPLYRPERQAEIDAEKMAAAGDKSAEQAADKVRGLAEDGGLTLADHEVAAVMNLMGEHGIDAQDALDLHLEGPTVEFIDNVAKTDKDIPYAPVEAERVPGPPDLGPDRGQPAQEEVGTGRGGPAGTPPAETPQQPAIDWRARGGTDFAAGKNSTPPADVRAGGLKALEEWAQGWHAANAAEPVPGVTGPAAPPPGYEVGAKPGYQSDNKIFTDDAAAAARARLMAKRNQLSAGVDPQDMLDGVTLAGWHIEKGARSFGTFAKAMVDDLGDWVKPHLRSWYEAVRYHPAVNSEGFTPHAEIESKPLEAHIADQEKANGPTPRTETVGGTGEGSLAPVAAEGIRAPEGDRETQLGGPQRGGADLGGHANPDEAGPRRAGGLGGGAGEVPVQAAGAGDRGRGRATDDAGIPREPDHGTVGPRPGQPGVIAQPRNSYVITEADRLGKGGQAEKLRDNISAITLLKALEEGNKLATPEQQAILARYVGWGGLSNAFPDASGKLKPDWERVGNHLKQVLTPEEYEQARRTVLDAHYTSEAVVRGIYRALDHLGFQGGRILEPSMGTGNFFGLMPIDMRSRSDRTGVEYDSTTGKIAKQLYQNDNVLAPMGFQDAPLADGYFDAAVGNPPFGSQRVPGAKEADIKGFSIHNYFFARTLNKLRPGGVMAMVVTNRFLDKPGDTERDWIKQRAEFLGAIRLPNTAFKENARTEVTTDIIFLRKYAEGEHVREATPWTAVDTIPDPAGGEPIPLNRYFVRNPEMMLGRMDRTGSMYGGSEPTLADDGRDMDEAMSKAIATLPEGVYERGGTALPTGDLVKASSNLPPEAPNAAAYHIGSYYPEGGKVFERVESPDGVPRAVEITPDTQWTEKRALGKLGFDRLLGQARVRDAARTLLNLEASDASDKMIDLARKQLNKTYDKFVAEHGYLSQDANARVFEDDPDKILWGLEKAFDPGISKERALKLGVKPRAASAEKADMFSRRVIPRYEPVTHADNPHDALAVTMAETGRVDVDHMAGLTGQTAGDIIRALHDDAEKPSIFKNPESGEWEHAAQYLSGNVKQKAAAASAAGLDKEYEALKAVFPIDKKASEIIIRAGTSWVDPKFYADFATHLLGPGTEARVVYLPSNGKFHVTVHAGDETRNQRVWGAADNRGNTVMDGETLFEKAVNNGETTVYTGTGDDRKVDKEATAVAKAKMQEVREEFENWVMKDPDRRAELTKYFNDNLNVNVKPVFDGSHLTLPGKVPFIVMRRHQNDAIWRGMSQRTALLDHVVGSGKTYTITATAMELRRTGLAKKSLIVVPNHLVEQWTADFYRLYPGAKLLAMTKKDFETLNRQKVLARLATGDWDAAVIGHSSFGHIGVHPETERKFLEKQSMEIQASIDAARAAAGKDDRTVKQMVRSQEKLRVRMNELATRPTDKTLTFEQLGVDQLFVDEAHEFKNLFFTTARRGMLGLGNPTGSKKAFDLFMKSQHLLDKQGGKGVVFATGTPISNSLSEMYTLQRYLGLKELEKLNLLSFDGWLNTFGDAYSDYELDGTGVKLKRVDRLRKLSNMPSLMALYGQYADSVTMEQIKQAYREENDGKEFPLPNVEGGGRKLVQVDRTPEQGRFMDDIIDRSQHLDPPGTKGGKNNMLAITSDARKAALDMRLIDPSLPESAGSKTPAVVQEVKRIYDKWSKDRGTQLVFCDLSIPSSAGKKEGAKLFKIEAKVKEAQEEQLAAERSGDEKRADDAKARISDLEEEIAKNYSQDDVEAIHAAAEGKFSVQDDLKAKLIASGIPENEIAFIHDANTDDQKADLFERVNAGYIRVLIGTSPKMGAGTNVQRRVVALHHMDVPWRPSDIEQREGRVIRQGNELYAKYGDKFGVEIKAYGTDQTYDGRMWQTQEQKLIGIENLRNYKGELELEDVAPGAASAAEMKAALSGNPLVMEDVRLGEDIRKLSAQERSHRGQQQDIEDELRRYRRAAADFQEHGEGYTLDQAAAEKYLENPHADLNIAPVTLEGQQFTDREAVQDRLKEIRRGKEAEAVAALPPALAAELDAAKQAMADGRRESVKKYNDVYDKLVKIAPYKVDYEGEQVSHTAALEKAAAHFGDIDQTAVKVGDKTLIHRSAIADAIGQAGGETTGTVAGIPWESIVEKNSAGTFDVSVHGTGAARGYTVSETAVNREKAADMAAYLVTKLPGAIAHRAAAARADAEGAAKRVPDLESLAGKPFAKADLLAEKKARHAEVRKLLTETEAPKPAETPEEGPAPRYSLPRTDKVTVYDENGQPAQADHYVVPGAEQDQGQSAKTAEQKRAEELARLKGAQTKMRSGKPQKGAGGMFGEDGGDQGSLFRTGAGDEGPDMSSARVTAIKSALESRLKQIDPSGRLFLRLVPKIEAMIDGKLSAADGQYMRRLIEVSLTSEGKGGPGSRWTFDHEVIHGLRDLGVFKDAEWQTLKEAALADATKMQEVRNRYKGQNLSEDRLIEERIADMFADWSKGRLVAKGFIRDAFERVVAYVKHLGASLREAGYKNVDDIFEGVERGYVGERDGTAPPVGVDERFAIRRTPKEDDESVTNIRAGAVDGPIDRAIKTARDFGASVGDKLSLGWDAFENSKPAMAFKKAAHPMALGSDRAQAAAKDFANAMRAPRFELQQVLKQLVSHFSRADLRAMYIAADNDSVLIGRGEAPRFLSELPKKQQTLVAKLQADNTWVANELKAEGLIKNVTPGYVPRNFAMMVGDRVSRIPGGQGAPPSGNVGKNLRTTSGNLKARKYETSAESEAALQQKVGEGATLIRDIRVLPHVTAQAREVLAGRQLVNAIKEIGKKADMELVKEGEQPEGWFTIDHPSLKTWTPELVKGEDGKWTPRLDQDGEMVFTAKPIYIHPEFQGPLRAVLDQSTSDMDTYNAFMKLKGAVMTTQLWSPFMHRMVVYGKSFPAMPGKFLTGAVRRDGNAGMHDMEFMRRMIGAGLSPIGGRAGYQDITSLMEDHNIAPGRSWTAKAAGLLARPFGEEASTRAKVAIDAAGDFWHNKMLWDAVFRMQVGLAKNFSEQFAKDGLPQGAADELAAHLANRYAGSIPIEAMSRGARIVANAVLFSRSFTLGNLGILKDTILGLPGDMRARLERDFGKDVADQANSVMRWKSFGTLMTDLAMSYVVNAALMSAANVMLAGVSPSDEGYKYIKRLHDYLHTVHEDPMLLLLPFRSLLALAPMVENEPGKEERVKYGHLDDNPSGGEGTALYARVPYGKTGEDIHHWFTQPFQTLKDKMAPGTKQLFEILSNDKGFGRQVYDPYPESAGDYARIAAAVVMHLARGLYPADTIESVGAIGKAAYKAGANAIHGRPAGADNAPPTLDMLKLAGGLAGITTSKGAPGGELAGEAFHAEDKAKAQRNIAIPEINKMIRNGDEDGARDLMDKLGMDTKAQNAHIRSIENPSISGGRLKQIYKKATPEDQARIDAAR